jgi:hypothetical protein
MPGMTFLIVILFFGGIKMKKIALGVFMTFVATLILNVLLLGQSQKTLSNADVLKLIQAGMDESVIVSLVKKNPKQFDLSPDALIELKKAGVTKGVLDAMIEADSPAPAPTAPAVAVTASPAVVSPPSVVVPSQAGWPDEVKGINAEVGIYYKKDGRFSQLYGKPLVATSTGGFMKSHLTLGISKVRSRSQLPGKHAQLQVTDRHPAFYFYMPEGVLPDSFNIIEMEEKGNRREFEVGSAGGANGSVSSGLKLDKVHQIVIERLAPRLFRVTPDVELEDGEYGFLGVFSMASMGVGGGGEKVYDFSIPKKKK